MKHVTPIAASLIFAFSSSVAVAGQTPDGKTPANEDVCDPVRAAGVTKGLYGLCVAFCEAQDCEATIDGIGEVTFDTACQSSSVRIYEKYAERKAPEDPALPCINVAANECPCWTEDELDNIADGGNDVCSVRDGVFHRIIGLDATTNALDIANSDNINTGPNNCRYQEQTPSLIIRSVEYANDDEKAACANSLIAECESRGF